MMVNEINFEKLIEKLYDDKCLFITDITNNPDDIKLILKVLEIFDKNTKHITQFISNEPFISIIFKPSYREDTGHLNEFKVKRLIREVLSESVIVGKDKYDKLKTLILKELNGKN
jgi:hypothetical protein